MNNTEIIQKTFDQGTSLSNGGELKPVQQTKFVNLVKKFSRLLPLVRFIRMQTGKQDIDKMHISEPVTEAIAENATSANLAQGKFSQISLVATKLRSAWDVTTEHYRNNIMQENQEDNLMETLTERIATDMEMLAIQGDNTITATDADARLLKRLDGWNKLTENAHIVDAAGKSISINIFSLMARKMPGQFKNDPGLKWVLSDQISNDWMNFLSERISGAGDAAAGGKSLTPLGREMIVVPLIPSDLSLSVTTGTPAEISGTAHGPFVIVTGTNDTFNLDVNSIGAANITLPAGVLDTSTVAKVLNAGFVTNSFPALAEDNGDGQIRIYTTSNGSAQSIDVGAGNANATLGFATNPAAVTGADAGSAGTVSEGSFAWFVNPMNLIFGLVDATRVYSKFNSDYDRTETRIFNEVAVAVENYDSIVKAKNIRRKDLS